jgi:P pilus assembly chaperone PapD
MFKGKRRVACICMALVLVCLMTVAAYAATITLSTESVRLSVSYPGASAEKTVTVRSSETSWGVTLTKKPANGKGVTVHQNRMSSFTIMAAANATPGSYEATVSSGGSKKVVKITVVSD